MFDLRSRGIDAPPTAGDTPEAERPAEPGPFYLHEAARIARFDGDAIARAAQDPRALYYGAGCLAVGTLIGHLAGTLSATSDIDTTAPAWLVYAVGAVILVPVQILLSAINIGLIHGAARLLFGATGRYVELLRVLWPASVVLWLAIVPVLGPLVGGIWYFLVSLVVLEEVDHVERLQALMLVIAFNILSLLVTAAVAVLAGVA